MSGPTFSGLTVGEVSSVRSSLALIVSSSVSSGSHTCLVGQFSASSSRQFLSFQRLVLFFALQTLFSSVIVL